MTSSRAMDDRDAHGLDRWCYDDLTEHVWEVAPFASVVLTRAAELVWIAFDHAPAMFVNVVDAIVPIEDFLAAGAPVATPPAITAAIRAHLLERRRPGGSTVLTVEVALEGAPAATLRDLRLRVGDEPRPWPMPGPDYAGMIGGEPRPGRAMARRLLVASGAIRAEVTASISGPSTHPASANHLARVASTTALEVAIGARRTLALVAIADRWPEVTLASS